MKFFQAILLATIICIGCTNSDEPQPTEQDYVNLLTNQINSIIIPAMEDYAASLSTLAQTLEVFDSNKNSQSLTAAREAFQMVYLKYQKAAIHNYFATANQALIETSNLYPIDSTLLEELIDTEAYNFGTTAQKRANGLPALDFMLFGTSKTLDYFENNPKRIAFIKSLVSYMGNKASVLVSEWSGSLKENFIDNGGTALGSSLSVQLNETMVYWETHIRENKVGIPIGRLGPNDSPIPPDASKIEAYYQSQFVGNQTFTLELLKQAVLAMEDVFLGRTNIGQDLQGYDDLLASREQPGVAEDIKNQFAMIYSVIQNRSSISGDEELYNALQHIVTLYKSDLFPILNIQDADGKNDGD